MPQNDAFDWNGTDFSGAESAKCGSFASLRAIVTGH
jgi:hypothetical protein